LLPLIVCQLIIHFEVRTGTARIMPV